MKTESLNSETGISGHFSFERITASEDFASTVMDRIEADKSGSFSSLPSLSRAFLVSLIFVIYSSIGVFLGVQEHKTNVLKLTESREKAINDLRTVHHLNPVSNFDNMLRPF